ncbi:MAG: hypothetical protein IJH12_03960 [Clostridia bacterium]|nr:hypothetical protein [Clostridia bacterium]
MFFIGVITNKNSENNIKNIMKDKLNESQIIFLNENNLENFRNVKFDSIVINNKIDDKYILEKITKKSKYVLYNSDITDKNKMPNDCLNLISYGFNSKANVTISSVEEDNYLLYIQSNINGCNKKFGMQEIRFEKGKNNINVYDGMITTIINLIYSK